jgi:hypothetical protein
MNASHIDVSKTGKEADSASYKASSSSIHCRPPAPNYDDRIMELEIENSRLHRLVAELLIKNQQLRKPD